MKKLMFAAMVGAAVMWFADPANGAQRRDALQRKLDQGRTNPAAAPTPIVGADGTRTDAPMFAAR